MPSGRGRRPPRELHPYSRLWLGLVVLLAAPAILSIAVFLPMPETVPIGLLPAFSALLQVARAAPLCAAVATAALAFAWRGDSLSERHRAFALLIVIFAWLVGVTTAGHLAGVTFI